MHFFPWLTEEFRSPLPPEELLHQLRASVAPPPTWRTLFRGSPAEPFRGQVNGNSFDLQRIIGGRDSMLPVIEGEVSTDYPHGSRLRLRHRLSWYTCVFATAWLSLTGGLAILLALGQRSSEGFWTLLAMFSFGLLLFTAPFWWEVHQSRPLLVRLLKLYSSRRGLRVENMKFTGQ